MNSNCDSLESVEWHLVTIEISPSYTEWVYHGEPVNYLYKGIESFDEGTGSNHFHEEDEMFGILNDLQASIEQEEKVKEYLLNEMPFNIRVDKRQL